MRHAAYLLSALVVGGCSFDWDRLDPIAESQPAGGGATGGTGGAGGTSEGGSGGNGGNDCPDGAGGMLSNTFGEVTIVAEFAGAANDDDPFFSEDLRELYFNSDREGLPFQIFHATRPCPTDPWSEPVRVEALDLGLESTTPAMTPDGLTLFVSYSLDINVNQFDIFMATRAAVGELWSTPMVVPELSSPQSDRVNWIRADGLLMGFDSERTGGGDLYTAQRTAPDEPWGMFTPIDDVNTPDGESEAWLSADQLTMYFSRESQIFRATRTAISSSWVETAVDELNDAGGSDPWLSPDERYIMFTRRVDGQAQIHQASR